jgi:hypothetical protein
MPETASHKETDSGGKQKQGQDSPELMPTLFRFIITIAVLAGIVYGAMFALVIFVEPKQAELSVRIPAEKLLPQK